MKSSRDVKDILIDSLLSDSKYIFVVFMITFVCLVVTIILSLILWRICGDRKGIKAIKIVTSFTKLFYNTFTTLISIFPLLGMLGTVFGLLGLDLASGDMENIKNNFFLALTSTAWGIIFSVFFKVAHGIIITGVESAFETSQNLIKGNIYYRG